MNTKTQTEIQISEDLTLSLPVVGCGKMITSPMLVNGWYLVPEDQDRLSIPKECIEIVEQWKESGIRVQGIVIAHDTKPEWWPIEPGPTPTTKPIQAPQKCVVEDIMNGVGEILSVVAPIIGIGLLIVLGAALGAACNDPVYIAVLADEYYENTDKNLWVEVHRWWE